jgi:hypothetical protein
MNPLRVLMEALKALEENDTNETLRVLHRHQQLTEIDTKRQSMIQVKLLRKSWIISLSRKRFNRTPASQPRLGCYNCRHQMVLIRSHMCLVVGVLGIEIAKKILAKKKSCRLG